MYVAKHNFGLIESILTEAIGVPGKRIFRFLVDAAPPAAATLWVEKEQVYGLAMALKKVMADKGEDRESSEEEILRMEDASLLQATSREVIEFKVNRLGLAYGPGQDHFTIFFHDERDEPQRLAEAEEESGLEEGELGEAVSASPPKLQICLTREQTEAFVNQSLEACASGRGVDSISRGALVATGKVDPNRNGHFRH